MVSRIKEKAVRSEKEMYELIINTAKDDDRIRAAYISGSRANPNAPRDIFMDYDVVYVVDCTAPFIEDKLWIDRFGERLFMQYPDENCDYGDSDKETCYGWLMQLADGNRIDLHVCTQKGIQQDLEEQMYIVLLDKDGILPPCEPGDRYYYVKKPSQKRFGEVCHNNTPDALASGDTLSVFYIRRVYSVYRTFQLILGDVKVALVVLVLLHALLGELLRLFCTLYINLVSPLKGLGEYGGTFLCDLDDSRGNSADTDISVNTHLCLTDTESRDIRLVLCEYALITDRGADDYAFGFSVENNTLGC